MKKVVLSGMVGNALEWYDYALFGHFATIISKHFFPSTDPYVSLIAAFSVFAAGFFMRPIGAIIFGHIGDRFGRRTALTSSIILMAICTAFFSILPTYEKIGILAPILLTAIRLLQGISLGGEFSGSIVFISEYAQKNRALVASSCLFSACIGILVGSFVGTFFSQMLPAGAFEQWGWRVPFVLGVAIGIVGLYIRHNIAESPHYSKAKARGELSTTPIRTVFTKYFGTLLIGTGIYLTVTVPFYTLTVFINSFMSKIAGHDLSMSLFINTISILAMTFLIPLSAYLSDTLGRKPLMVWSALAMLLAAYPAFWLLTQDQFIYLLLGQLLFAIPVGFFLGPVPIVLVDLFPIAVRYTGLSLSYNFAAAFFGGTTPMAATWLIEVSGHKTAPSFYVIACAAITLFTLIFYKESRKAK
ncbi:MAG: MFS transporter [Proteobacteria bacterium]|nr:MFS transporter [Pseudomonadota bacterium]